MVFILFYTAQEFQLPKTSTNMAFSLFGEYFKTVGSWGFGGEVEEYGWKIPSYLFLATQQS